MKASSRLTELTRISHISQMLTSLFKYMIPLATSNSPWTALPRMPFSVSLMCHRIRDVVDAQLIGLNGHLGGVRRIVCPFPGVAVIHVEADRHHETSLVVVYSAPMRHLAVFALVGIAGSSPADVWHLDPVGKIVDHMENGVGIFHFHDGTVGKDSLHRGKESLPLRLAVKVVDHKKTPTK